MRSGGPCGDGLPLTGYSQDRGRDGKQLLLLEMSVQAAGDATRQQLKDIAGFALRAWIE